MDFLLEMINYSNIDIFLFVQSKWQHFSFDN